MLNYVQQNQQQRFIEIICLIMLFWVPHIGLDYVFDAESGRKLQLPNGQYVFFFSSLLASVYLLRSTRFDDLRVIFSYKTLWAGMALLLLGVTLSSTGVWGWRLAAIVGLCSVMSIIAANFVMSSSTKTQALAAFLVMVPFFIPVLGSVFLEFFGPIDVGVELVNLTHAGSRWRFLNMSANGFGFDAAFVSLFLAIGVSFAKHVTIRLILIVLLFFSLYALVLSGTRAAYIFFLVALTIFAVIKYGRRAMLVVVGAILFTILFVFISDSVETVKAFLRLEGTLERISSNRWVGIVGMWDLFNASPLMGLGFGAADDQFPIYPSNIFYMGLLAEVGIFGFLGVLFILAYPIKYFVVLPFKLIIPRDAPLLVMCSAAVLAGFVPYLMFEFDVLRVSVNNQLFFFCWGVLMFHFMKVR